jgi:phage gp16-like protein
LQINVTGKASLRDMDDRELKLVVNRLKQDGFEDKPRNPRHKPAPRADLRMIHVLWRKLGERGALRDPSRAGLNTFIRARFEATWGSVPADVDMLRDWQQIDAVIQALKSWGQRAGIDFDWEDHAR